MIDFNKYFIVGTNSYALHDTMNGLVIGELIRCKDCKYVGTDATCCLVCNREGMGLRPFHVYHDDYCSYAERKEE